MLPEDVEAGTSFDVEAVVYADDNASFGAVGSFVADGGGPHMVEATVERPSWIDPDELESEGEFAPPPGSMCEVEVYSGSVALDGYTELQWAPDPPESDGSELGDLIASVTSVDAPAIALAELLWMQPEPAFDTIYIAPTSDPSSISVERDGTCREIRSVYVDSDAQFVFVTQRWGCPERPETIEGDTVIETVTDEPWLVQVEGSPDGVATVIGDLRAIEIPGGEGVDGPPEPTADAWIDGYIESNDGVTELARYEWRTGKISIVRREEGGEMSPYENPVVGAGGDTVPCTQ